MNFVVRNCSERLMRFLKQLCEEHQILISQNDFIEKFKIESLNDFKKAQIGLQQKDSKDDSVMEKEDFEFQEMKLKRNMTIMPKQTLEKVKSQMEEKRDECSERILAQLQELKEEVECARSSLCDHAKDHINDNDLILTCSYSNSMIEFLKEAHSHIKFEVVVCETSPIYNGHRTAKELAKAGIKCNLVQDAAAFAVMSRVDKVILSTHGIMANGGIISQCGALNVAYAAHAHQVPVFAMGSFYKLTPLHPTDQHTYNEYLEPSKIFRADQFDELENIEVVVPAYDYVPPRLVNVILTSQEDYTPENIYRAFHELYGRHGNYLAIE